MTPPSPNDPGNDDALDLRTAITAEDETSRRFVIDRVYDELRGVARRFMRGERRDHTLQPTELVNEACLRLLPLDRLDEITARRFLAFGARAMRQVLVDHARQNAAQKRGAGWIRVTMQHLPEDQGEDQIPVTTLDAAMSTLEATDGHLCELTELHYFGGLTGDQLAEHYGVSRSTVTRELSLARALLLREIDRIESDRT